MLFQVLCFQMKAWHSDGDRLLAIQERSYTEL